MFLNSTVGFEHLQSTQAAAAALLAMFTKAWTGVGLKIIFSFRGRSFLHNPYQAIFFEIGPFQNYPSEGVETRLRVQQHSAALSLLALKICMAVEGLHVCVCVCLVLEA